MEPKTIVSPDDQGATFIELFFDLVFVFAITQVTHYAAHHLGPEGIFRSAVVFWLIWWGWSQFTWALNAANTNHHFVRVAMLVATGIAFVMATAVEKAFGESTGQSMWFAASYISVRVVGLTLYYRVVHANPDQRSAVVTFAGLSVAGLVAVAVGAVVDPSLRVWFWLVAAGLDLSAAAAVGNKRAWGLHAGHFAERHGLIVIIALGESLIVAGNALTSDASNELLLVGSLAVVITCLLWWTYFGWVREVLEEKLIENEGNARSVLGRDAYTFLHFPLVSGVIALAVAFEGAFHPDDYSIVQIAAATGVGLTLFLGSTALALWRAVGCVLWNRLIVSVITLGALALSASSSPLQVLSVAVAGLVTIVAVEQVTVRKQLV